jgi:hypothetical protein
LCKILEQAQVPVLEAGLIKDVPAPLVGEGPWSWLQNIDSRLERAPLRLCSEAALRSNAFGKTSRWLAPKSMLFDHV